MNEVRPWLTECGKFPVEHIPCPHESMPVNLSGPRTFVIHTMESPETDAGFEAGMSVFRQHYAPHFAVGPNKIAQLVQIGTIGAALRTHNWVPIFQVEVTGRSQQTPWQFTEPVLERLAALLATCAREYGTPLSRPFPDEDWGRYGDNPNRHAGKWGVVAGGYGHVDAPYPDVHWDPGHLKWSELFAKAASMTDILHAPGWVAPPAPARLCCVEPVAPRASLVSEPPPWQGTNGWVYGSQTPNPDGYFPVPSPFPPFQYGAT